ncbi:MAG: hypothetical protein LKF47_01370 [Megasphaera sp.]|jgi:flavorubredoxin|nr:hypothetical protein [Megasphaera sp.]
MTLEEVQRRFRCGNVEESYENSKLFSVFMQIIFTAVGIYFFWLMLDEGTFVERLDNMAVLLFCLWRIHRQRDIICYVTEKGLIVRRQFMSFQEFYNEQVHEEKNLVFLPYKDIFSISDNWQEIQLGQAVEGGIAVLPVHLQFLSKKHKQHIIDRIEEAREEDDDE